MRAHVGGIRFLPLLLFLGLDILHGGPPTMPPWPDFWTLDPDITYNVRWERYFDRHKCRHRLARCIFIITYCTGDGILYVVPIPTIISQLATSPFQAYTDLLLMLMQLYCALSPTISTDHITLSPYNLMYFMCPQLAVPCSIAQK